MMCTFVKTKYDIYVLLVYLVHFLKVMRKLSKLELFFLSMCCDVSALFVAWYMLS